MVQNGKNPDISHEDLSTFYCCQGHKLPTKAFFLIKPRDALISQIYFCQETLHVSGSSSAYHQEFSTVHSALAYIMQV